MSLKTQRRLASEILKTGQNRVWLDPERIEEIEVALTRGDIRRLIHEKSIKALAEKGVSRSRARFLHERRKIGRRRGVGSREGSPGAKVPRKDVWIHNIRVLRRRLKTLREGHLLTKKAYRQLYRKAKGGTFKNASHLEQYLKASNLIRRR